MSGSDFDTRVATYLETRLEQYCGWYDARAIKMKRAYTRARVTAAVGSVTVPVLAQLSWQMSAGAFAVDAGKVLTTIVSTLVAVLLALEGVLHHREQWKNYRTTEQHLRAQRVFFETRTGDYFGLSDETALKRLIETCEAAIKDENELTLSVLTRSSSPVEVDASKQ
jgi:hypothetical protein